jgi:hypothetical protein
LDDNGDFETEGETVTFTPDTVGTYTITLEVRDDDGDAATAEIFIEVES